MASINKLAVRGIRAFSPDDKEQVVEFYTPVTMIVGRNGCGKTTIIEALRYAITGSFPPGGSAGKSGQAFVHDPRGATKTTVKASVKLRFVSRGGKDFVVNRAMELTQKKSAVSFKQLDGVLRFTDEESGQTVKASHKCGELDKQVPTLLGISKAILDNVLFVHQEEASWPLMEGAVLKKRFDEIFDSTRYTKALDIIRKTEKDFRNDIKEIMIDLSALDARKDAMRAFRMELSEQNDIEEDLQANKNEIQNELSELETDIARFEEIVNKVDALRREKRSLEAERVRISSAIQKQRQMLDEDLSKIFSLDEIQAKLEDFDSKVSRQKEEECALLAKERDLQARIDELHAKEMDLKADVGKWVAKKEAHEQRLKDRFLKMERLAQTYSIDLNNITQLTQGSNVSFLASTVNESFYPSQDSGSHEVTPDAWHAFKRSIKKKKEELEDQLREHQQSTFNDDDRMQKEIAELYAKIASHENEIENRRSEINRIMPRGQTALGRLKQSEVDDLKQRAESLGKQRQDLVDNPRRTDIPIEILQLEGKMKIIQGKLDEEKQILDGLRDSMEASNELKVLQEDCRREYENLEASIVDESSRCQQFNVALPKILNDEDEHGESLRTEIGAACDGIQTVCDTLNSKLGQETDELTIRQRAVAEVAALTNRSHRALLTLKAQLSQIGERGSVDKVRKLVDDLRAEGIDIPQDTDEKNPDALLVILDAELEKGESHQHGAGFTSEVATALNRYIKRKAKVQTDSGNFLSCPCCDRDMSEDDFARLKVTLRKLLLDASVELTEVDPKASDLKQKLQESKKILQSSMSDLRDFCRLSAEENALETEMEKLKSEAEKAKKSLNDQKNVVEDLRGELCEVRVLVDSARRWSEDAIRIAGKLSKISQKRVDLSIHAPQLENRDIRTVEREVATLSDEKDKLATRINDLNKEMSKLNTMISDLSERASKAAEMARTREDSLRKQQDEEKKRKDFDEELRRLRDEEVKIDDAMLPLRQKLKSKESNKQRSRALRGDQEKELASLINDFQAEVGRLYELAQKIDEYLNSDDSDKLQGVEAELSSIAAKIVTLKEEVHALQPEIAHSRGLLKNQEREKAQLQFNIAIFEQQQQLDKVDQEAKRIEARLSKIEGHDTAYEELDEAASRRAELIEKKALLEGRYSEIVERIRSLKRKLSSQEYKDVDEEHRVATIKKETTHIAADDLKKYEKALDQALLQYHSVKIAEVNKLIRELWMTTYKGEDITNIEIVSGQEPGSKAAKSYNYRVVMTKGNTDLDMRGRCSAGQRVLASLVIRLALAETFGVNCGCIALDEPTVNLDYNNKKGLSQALAQLVEHRSKQKNFQLILITHDEEFVTMMKNELQCHTGFSMPEHYFRVCRELGPDGKYYSKIHIVDWDEEN